ncbi:M48 family metallopeptidase [Sulfurimonas sp.]|nr:M48 family metallopeptidase [Sulfurimonas sp.]
MKILDDAQIILTTPKVSHQFIVGLLTQKEAWIRKKVFEVKKYSQMKINLEKEVLLFGEVYTIDREEVSALRLKLDKLRITSMEKSIKCYNSFYKEYANDFIVSRVEYFSKQMNLEYLDVKFRKMKARWGSCNSKKVLTFNIELMKIKKELIDYVVVHELAHLKHMNHSREFHELVDQYLINSKHYRKELKKIKIPTYSL